MAKFLGQELTLGEEHLLQRITLKDTTHVNPLLPGSPQAVNNYQLNTVRKDIIRAINEVYIKANNAGQSITGLLARFEDIVGIEYDTEIDDYALLKSKYVNLMKAIVDIDTELTRLDNFDKQLAGDTIKATNDPNSIFNKITVNQYADRAPGAWTGTREKFIEEIASKLKLLESHNKKEFDGTYFIQ